MEMNSKGQLAIFGIMMFLFTFLFALATIPAMKEVTTLARDSQHLDCANTSISTGTAATCLVVDFTMPYFLAVIIIGGAAWIFAKQAFGS